MVFVPVRIHGDAVVDVGNDQVLATEPVTSGDQPPELIVVDRFRISYPGFWYAVDVSVPIRIQDLVCVFADQAETVPCSWYEVRADISGCRNGHSE